MEKKIESLEIMEICVTSKCNLSCKHCYQDNEKNQFVLSYSKIKEIIDYCEHYNCKKYILTGGEYFTHPNAYDILHYLVNSTSASIVVVTNCTHIDLDKIISLPNNRIKFKVSIDGDKNEHNFRRGDGMYERTLNNIKALTKNGYKVDITMTLVESNIHCIPNVLSEDVFKNITLLPVATTGAACNYFSTSQDSSAYISTIKHIYKTCRIYHDGKYRCLIFPYRFSVKYDGNVYPCNLARDYNLLSMGNINEKNVSDVINDFLLSEKSDIFFEYINNEQINKCNHCKNNNECPRGCRVRAYKWSGKLIDSDPFGCKIFNDEYKDYTLGEIYWGNKQKNK